MRQPRDHGIGLAMAATAFLLATTITPAAAEGPQEPFPSAVPESVGLSSVALEQLADEVAAYVEREMVVGAELLVIKDRQTVLHEAFGWRDRETEAPMEPDTLFNIRSMTKPLTGAAAQTLVDDGLLELDDRVADHLPGFANEASGAITIEQLLTHTSGLPLSIVQSTDEYESLAALADAVGRGGPEFEPGSRFWYSDAGTDTLGAVVEQASGMSLADYVAERLLDPLGMEDSYYAGTVDAALLEHTASLYVGGVGEWTRFWGPESEPFYPFAWGSQSLYTSPRDYARFLAMWLDDGATDGREVLSPEAVARMLTPKTPMGSLGSDAPYPTRFPDLHVYHGQMAVLHVDGEPVDGRPPAGAEAEIVGYSGSDGTIAWAWPERDLMVLYFTQSRGGSTPIRLEAEIARLLLEPAIGPAAQVPHEYADVLGTYTADFGPFRREPFEILWRDAQLALDIPSQFIFPLDAVGEGRWALRGAPGAELDFARDEAGAVIGLRLHQGGSTFDVPKGKPVPEVEVALEPGAVEPYLGWYREEGSGREVEVLLQEGRLAVRIPETLEPLELFPPDEDEVWRVRMSPAVGFEFIEEDGEVVAYVARGPGGESTFRRFDPDA
ncbi:MAG: serine hydrolase domain-containing protein [Candidatus Limnocylindrales bacterium]